jgi:transposase
VLVNFPPRKSAFNGHTVRVYDLAPSLFRIDTTTASSYAEVRSEHGLVQFGHSKDRDDLPQVRSLLITLFGGVCDTHRVTPRSVDSGATPGDTASH